MLTIARRNFAIPCKPADDLLNFVAGAGWLFPKAGAAEVDTSIFFVFALYMFLYVSWQEYQGEEEMKSWWPRGKQYERRKDVKGKDY